MRSLRADYEKARRELAQKKRVMTDQSRTIENFQQAGNRSLGQLQAEAAAHKKTRDELAALRGEHGVLQADHAKLQQKFAQLRELADLPAGIAESAPQPTDGPVIEQADEIDAGSLPDISLDPCSPEVPVAPCDALRVRQTKRGRSCSAGSIL